MKLTKEQKRTREEFRQIEKSVNKELGKDKIKFHNVGDPDFSYRSFILFSGTHVSEGGWLIGRKWMSAKIILAAEHRWAMQSYKTRVDNYLKQLSDSDPDFEKLMAIHTTYDLTAGCAQCGGCRWFAAFDADYGVCCNKESPNDGKITFEHGGCIKHSFIQQLLTQDWGNSEK